MGMFDIVKCEMPLPGKNPCPRVDKFQTRDFKEVPCGNRYLILPDGTLLCEGKYKNFSGEVTFYDADWNAPNHRCSAWWEYEATFVNGKCVKLTCIGDGVVD